MAKAKSSKPKMEKAKPAYLVELKKAEAALEKKQKELVEAKLLHKKLAGEFIEHWLIVRRIKKKHGLVPGMPKEFLNGTNSK
jgi:hypothetical protein